MYGSNYDDKDSQVTKRMTNDPKWWHDGSTIFVVTIGHIPQMVTNLFYIKSEIDASTLPLLLNF
jgi:hypothetical protein